jgi:hypothetical protein
MRLSQSLSLITLSDNADTPAVPNHAPEDPHPDGSVEPSVTTDENKPGWRSTASAAAKLLLRAVNQSSDAFPPLKSVAGGLCAILENSEV